MTQSSYPFANSPILDASQWSKMAQNWLETGIIKGNLNELLVYADSTGMQVKAKSGQAWIKGHFFESDVEEVLAISTADSTNPRIDRVIVRLDWAENTIQLAVLQGVPAVSPSAPALTQNTSRWEISLAQVRVNANVSTITAGNITDERAFTRAQAVLWSGASYVGAGSTIPPTKKLSNCRNGWILVWSDYDPSIGSNDYNYYETFIAKATGTLFNGKEHSILISGGVTATSANVTGKSITIFDDKITGTSFNEPLPENTNNSSDVCLRYVIEV
ncbi:hypothetical protein J7E63_12875 [Bacillus sp. ISL-75]|uniref:hypothetical protein n=1 Tax=Bacillus sp. ISL-75 TaxID=2819137 RepID=UPI001BE7C287|nr:hypothetical protein [Bacillus sp. ISL-75]MBT2727832.1 hypothetical protein [Bacillus sp. ISL-75]